MHKMGKVPQIRLALQACFKAHKEPLTRDQILVWIAQNYGEANFERYMVGTQLHRSCANVRHRHTTAPQILWRDESSDTYRLLSDEVPSSTSDVLLKAATLEGLTTDFLEKDLRDYLARHLEDIEAGLQLWSNNPSSVEYQIDRKRIDILARDAKGVPVIIELKLNRGHEKTIGQVLYYRGALIARLGVPRVRIMLVARNMSNALRIASSELKDVTLHTYELAMKFKSA